MANMHQLLKAMIEKGASDLHITTGTAPQLRIDGKLHPLGTARFDLGGEDWSMGTEDGTVALSLDAQGERHEDLNLGLVVSRFRQRFGTYSGTVRIGEEVIEVDDLYGVAEDHHAVW